MMKAIILCGGLGTRLEPYTHVTQKQLLPIANKPTLGHILEQLANNRVNQIGIVVGGRHPKKVKQYISNNNWDHTDINLIEQGDPEGLAHAVLCAEYFVDNDPFLIYFGDTIIENQIINSVAEGVSGGSDSGFIPLQKVSEPSRFGIANIRDGNLIGFDEKPEKPKSDLAYIGAVGVMPVIFDYIRGIKRSDRGELELTDALDEMVRGEKVNWKTYNGTWIDVGTPHDLIRANRYKLMTEIDSIKIGKDCSVDDDTELIEPVVIGDQTSISGCSEIGPYTSIGSNCQITNSSIENSIIYTGTQISTQDDIVNSVIGPNSTVKDSPDTELLLGPESNITL